MDVFLWNLPGQQAVIKYVISKRLLERFLLGHANGGFSQTRCRDAALVFIPLGLRMPPPEVIAKM